MGRSRAHPTTIPTWRLCAPDCDRMSTCFSAKRERARRRTVDAGRRGPGGRLDLAGPARGVPRAGPPLPSDRTRLGPQLARAEAPPRPDVESLLGPAGDRAAPQADPVGLSGLLPADRL